MGGEVVFNHADYRLLSRRTRLALEFGESNLFLRGIVPMVGFKSDTVTYERGERFAGEQVSPEKNAGIRRRGITSLSAKPMRLILSLGVLILVFALVALAVTVIRLILAMQ